MLVEQLQISTSTPAINFATPGTIRPARQSTIQKLCAEYERTLAAFKSAHAAFAQAETAAHKARQRPDSLIRPTKRNFDDVFCNVHGGKRRPITSSEILNEIAGLRSNSVKEGKSNGARVVTFSDAGFPLTPKQKARLARVEARLPLARAYEAECAAVEKRFRVKELDAAAQVPSRKLEPLALRIAALPSENRQDLLAKARLCELDPDVSSVGEDVALSIARDFARLAAAGLI
jgi:hypothetical protein